MTDRYEQYLPDQCGCGTPLDKSVAKVLEVRQIFDISEPKLEVTEHQKLGCPCANCGAYNEGLFPDTVKAHIQYGAGVNALLGNSKLHNVIQNNFN